MDFIGGVSNLPTKNLLKKIIWKIKQIKGDVMRFYITFELAKKNIDDENNYLGKLVQT